MLCHFLVNHRQEEIDEYIRAVQNWTSSVGSEFSSLQIAPVPLSQLTNFSMPGQEDQLLNRHVDKAYSERQIRLALGLAYINSEGLIIERPIEERKSHEYDDFQVEYDSVSYSKMLFAQSEADLAFPSLQSLNISDSQQVVYLAINDQIVPIDSPPLHLLQKHLDQKKTIHTLCHKNGGILKATLCTTINVLTKVCILVDREKGRWQHKGYCGTDYKDHVNDSSVYQQEVSFVDRSVTVEVKSWRDPKILFRNLTRGTNRLDDEPTGEIIGGVLLLLFGLLLLAQASFLFFKKYERTRWMRKLTGQKQRRDQRYLDQEMQKKS